MGIAHVTLSSSSLKVLGKLLLPLIKFGQNEFLQKSRLRCDGAACLILEPFRGHQSMILA